MADVAMPRLSDSMEEGTILKWLKSDGDEVSRGEELVEIETDKANMTYEADSDGVLAIVAAVVGLAHELGLVAIAEGVETHRQLQVLRRLGCDYAQGFLYSRALPPEEIDALLISGLDV